MSLPMIRSYSLCLAALLLVSGSLQAENWPQWRGAQLDGISHETGLPTSWNATENGMSDNIAWKVKLPGAAGATPVVWEDQIFLTSVDDSGNLLLLCYGTNGKRQWQQTVSRGNQDVRGDEGNSAAPSPSTDGKHVWAFMANGALACYTVDGEEVWKLNVQDRYGKLKIAFGMTSTPVLDNGRLYLQLIHGEGKPETREAMVVALEGATGKEIWQHKRTSDARAECEHSYASPVLYRHDDTAFLLTHGADYTIAHDLETGAELWRVGELNPKATYNPTLRFVASPLASPGMIVIPSAKNGPVFAVKPGVSGDITDQSNAFHWTRSKGTPDVPSPLRVGDLVYLCRENGNLVCVDAKSGETIYEERTVRDRHRASPVYADGKIYTTARKGIVTVVKEGREFEVLAENDLGESIAASPAISGGTIYFRTFESLIAVGK